MTLDAAVRAFIDATPPESREHLDIPRQRQLEHVQLDWLFLRFAEAGPEVASITDHRVPVVGGEITVRVYRPDEPGELPCLISIHGGAWWCGTINDLVVDARCREVAIGARSVVASVEYRLAPEHKFPTGLEDCYAALCWVYEHARDLGVDRSRISIGGASAGANLSAAVCLKARDAGGPPIAFQILEVPAVDLANPLPSGGDHGEQLGLSADDFNSIARQYVAAPADVHDPLASPMLAASHVGLPPAHIMTAEFDPLRGQGEAYARKLEAAHVPVTWRDHPGATHGSSLLTRVWAPARDWRAEIIDELKQANARQVAAGAGKAARPDAH
jgi:acetyl esterase